MAEQTQPAQPTQQAPAAPAPGSPEYNAAMIAKARGTTPAAATTAEPTQGTPAAATSVKAQRPEWVPEKFWDAEKGEVRTEALAKSYGELERTRLTTQQTAEPTPAAQPVQQVPGIGDQPKTEPTTTEQPAAAKPELAAVRAAADQEFAKDGKLSDGTYKNLEAHGLTRETVDSYIAGEQAKAQVVLSGLYSAAGGQDQYMNMIRWAAAGNYTAAEVKAFDTAVRSTDDGARSMAVQGLRSRFTAAHGTNSTLITPTNSANSGGSVSGYQSRQEVTAAMNDVRYQRGDKAYHAEVAAKIKAGRAAGHNLGLHVMQSGNI